MNFPLHLTTAVILCCSTSCVWGETPWRAGTDMRRLLDSDVGVTWQDSPLKSSLNSLAMGQPFAILLDRRIDPDQRITFAVKDERLEVMMLRLADQQKLGFSAVANVLYLGPAATAKRLATVAALRRGDLPVTHPLSTKIIAKKPVEWKELAQPRELILATAKAYGLTVANPTAIPHDLWAAAKWPAMNFADRMTLLLAGFELSYELDPQRQEVRIVRMPPHAEMEMIHTYGGDMKKGLAEISKLFPDLEPKVEGGTLRIIAAFETQEKVHNLLTGQAVKTTKVLPGEKRYSMKVEKQPAGAVVATMAKGLEKEAKYLPEVRTKLMELVSFQVKEVTAEELLTTALKPLGLKVVIGEKTIEVLAE